MENLNDILKQYIDKELEKVPPGQTQQLKIDTLKKNINIRQSECCFNCVFRKKVKMCCYDDNIEFKIERTWVCDNFKFKPYILKTNKLSDFLSE